MRQLQDSAQELPVLADDGEIDVGRAVVPFRAEIYDQAAGVVSEVDAYLGETRLLAPSAGEVADETHLPLLVVDLKPKVAAP